MYFKLSTFNELENTSYRICKSIGTDIYIEYICGDIKDTWKEITKEEAINLGLFEIEPEPTPEPQLTETEQAILDTAINVDYLVCMKELEI